MATHSNILPGKSHGQGNLWRASVHRVAKESDTTQRLNNNTDTYTHTHTHPHTYTPCILSIHPSVGTDRCSHVLAVVNNAAANIGVDYLSELSFVWIYVQEQDCRRQLWSQCFGDRAYCSPQCAHQATFPPAAWEGALFSAPSPHSLLVDLDGGHLERCGLVPHCGSDLRFSNNQQR